MTNQTTPNLDALVADLQAIARASNLSPTLCQRVEDAAAALTTLSDKNAKLVELVRMWRNLVNESGGVPRYTITPGAALNTLVTWTDQALGGSHD